MTTQDVTPWVAKLHQWAPSPPCAEPGSKFYGGEYWTVFRKGGRTSGGFRTRKLAREHIAAVGGATS